MTEPAEKKPEPAKPEEAPARVLDDRPDPEDATGEAVNAIDLVGDLISGAVRPRDIARTLAEKVFGKPSSPKKDEEPKPTTAVKLTAIEGGAAGK